MTQNFDAALGNFVKLVQEMTDARYASDLPTLTPPVFEIDPKGRKYIRIIRQETFGAGRSVFCFIEASTGNVMKAASWKAPAPHARGNIYGENPLAGVTPYGPAYLR